jgi:hypothetical protein
VSGGESEDDLLRPWRAEGQWDSQGSFTLDPAQAMEKLRAFALAQPRRYILNLVSWAVAAGATSFDVTARAGRLEVVTPGLPLSYGELRELFSERLTDEASLLSWSALARRELTVATITASGLPQARVTLSGQGGRLTCRPGGFQLESQGDGPTRWLLEESRSLIGWVGRALRDETLEIPILRESCAHAEISITVNGAPIYRPLALPRIRKAIHLVSPAALPVEPEQLADPTVESRPSPGAFSALVVASTTPILSTSALYLVRGVSFEMPPVEVYGTNFAVVVSAPELRKDLSGTTLVRDERCRLIEQQVAQAARELWDSP